MQNIVILPKQVITVNNDKYIYMPDMKEEHTVGVLGILSNFYFIKYMSCMTNQKFLTEEEKKRCEVFKIKHTKYKNELNK